MTDRGVSTVLSYVLSLAILTILLTGMFAVSGDLVSDQRERVVRSELRVLGNRLAADVTTADRLALSEDDVTARIERSLPPSVAGTGYSIQVSHPGSSGPLLVNLTTHDPDVTVTVRVNNETAVAETTVSGGDLVVRYDGTEVVIERA